MLQAMAGTLPCGWWAGPLLHGSVMPDDVRRAWPAVVAGGSLALTGIVAPAGSADPAVGDRPGPDGGLRAGGHACLAGTDDAGDGRERRRAGAAGDQPTQRLAARRHRVSAYGMRVPSGTVGRPATREWPAWSERSAPRQCGARRRSLVLAPFAVRTAIATGEWQVLPAHGGLNAYIGNHRRRQRHVHGGRGHPAVDRRASARTCAGWPNRPPARRCRTRRCRDTSFGRARVVATVACSRRRLLAYKAWLTTHAWELPVNVSYAWFREQVRLLWMLPLGAWLLIPVGLGVSVAGAVMVPASHAAAWRAFRWLLPTYLASVALFFVVDRYRAPALVLCAVHLGILASWVSDRDARAAAMQATGARLRVTIAVCLALALGAASLIQAAVPAGRGGRRHANGRARHRQRAGR